MLYPMILIDIVFILLIFIILTIHSQFKRFDKEVKDWLLKIYNSK